MLAMHATSDHKNLDDVLHFITYTLCNKRQLASPYYLLYAHASRSSLDIIFPFSLHNQPSLSATHCQDEEACRLARLRILASQERSKHRYNIHHQRVCYVQSDLVWLWTLLCKRDLCQTPVPLHWPFYCA